MCRHTTITTRLCVRAWPQIQPLLPCPVPQKDEFDQRVRVVQQSPLGDTGDPQPVVQYVQIHGVSYSSSGGAGSSGARSCGSVAPPH